MPPPKVPQSRLSRWRPQSTFGCGLYLAVIGGAAILGYSLALREQVSDGREWLLAGGFALSALMILTIWRNLLISGGALTPKHVVTNESGHVQTAGGINWWGLIGILIALALAKIGADQIKKKVLAPRPPTRVKSPDIPRLRTIPDRTIPPTTIRPGSSAAVRPTRYGRSKRSLHAEAPASPFASRNFAAAFRPNRPRASDEQPR